MISNTDKKGTWYLEGRGGDYVLTNSGTTRARARGSNHVFYNSRLVHVYAVNGVNGVNGRV